MEVFSNLVYEINVETREDLLHRNVDVTTLISNRHILFFTRCVVCYKEKYVSKLRVGIFDTRYSSESQAF